MVIEIIILIVLLMLSAFFSGIESAFVSIPLVKVKSFIKKKKKNSFTLLSLKENPKRTLITILIGNNLVNIGAASLATVVFTDLFGSKGIGMATGIMTLLVLIFGEITPKSISTQHAEKVALLTARLIKLIYYIFFPLVIFFEWITKLIIKLFKIKKVPELSEEELQLIISQGYKEGVIDKESAKMIQNIIEFESLKVADVMIHESDVQMIDSKKKVEDVIDFIIEKPFSRFPVYEKNRDNIIGIIDTKEILKSLRKNKLNTKVKKLIKKVPFVPETKYIDDLLVELEGKDHPIAIVVDEYGAIMGIVTIEDILEEIVGDIFDKSKIKQDETIKQIKKGIFKIDAKTPVQDINDLLKIDLKNKHYNTLAGLIQYKLNRMPKKGEKIELKDIILEVMQVTKKEIKKVKIIEK